ncbi:LysR family transcriptional regulator [Longimycelium tulufanense]|uniref:LysR family transcriptional regulator n=1 Tax=Longimycelium tulufanense TaxID=907463 RepID=A0A8J3CL81_9PSEU|nr:LysR family transcriptional regulator [Longimycelium tulufanense]GGM83844.1 LysR family transcriptional regulator [Longimycelium tulufanense]
MDLNLLVALDVLLEEESVTAAAARLHLSPSAMSRTLARIRSALGDPILVRAGRRLVPTPRAQAMRPRVRALVEDAAAVFRPVDDPGLESLRRTFVIRANDAYIGTIAAPLVRKFRDAAPHVTVRFAAEGEEDTAPLRDGSIDLDLGVIGELGPEVRVQELFRDTFVAVVRTGHPLAREPLTPERLVEYPHISASRRGRRHGPLDEVLAACGLFRTVAVVVPTFSAALTVAAASDLVATVPALAASTALRTGRLAALPLPFQREPVTVSQAWHPRMDGDAVHRWLRHEVAQVCREVSRPAAEQAGPVQSC